MKPNLISVIITVAILMLFASCKDIIEPDISKKEIQLEAPGNNYQSLNYTINFWWDELEDATQYHLQVVTPKFDSVANLVLDTILKTNKFAVNLSPGSYEWRVRAENGSYKTPYSQSRTFAIFQSSIKQQKVQLLSPQNNFVTNSSSASFNWGSLYGATNYRLQIDTNNFINESTVLYNQVTPGQQITFTFPKDQVYQWRVRAENDTAQAQWSVINNITYDHTPPPKVSLSSPQNNQTLSLPVALQWGNAATAVRYKLYVYKSDSTTPYNNTFPLTLTNNIYSFNLGSYGEKIYWKVTATDAAGNESADSEVRNFVLQ